jgi:hypothetical protein
MTAGFSLADLTSKKGWVRTRCDLRIWIPIPAGFPPELGFAFRSEEFETDVQVMTGTPDLRQLHKAIPDIEDFVHAMSVYDHPEQPA